MAKNALDFMSKPHKAYPCGKDAQKAIGVLSQAFTASSKRSLKKEQARFDGLLENVAKTKTGQETLLSISDFGYSFAFEKGDFGGYCCPDEKKIVLNPEFSDNYLMRTVVHEATHAIQGALQSENFPSLENMTVASILLHNRSVEADAVAHEMAFVHEAKDILPEVYNETKEEGLPMFDAFVVEMDKSGNEKKAMQECFKAWFECDYYRNFYDDYHKNQAIKAVCDYGKSEQNPDCFSKEVSIPDVLKTCLYQGKPYMSEKDIKTGLAFAISDKDKQEIFEMVTDYATSVPNAKLDKSVLSMNSREEIFAQREVEKNNKAPVLDVKKLKNTKEGR